MKIRLGFVSNSSSSSFIVLCKSKFSTKEELRNNNIKMICDSRGFDINDEDEKEYVEKLLKEYGDKQILVYSSIDSEDTESSVHRMVQKLLNNLGFKSDEFEINWDGY